MNPSTNLTEPPVPTPDTPPILSKTTTSNIVRAGLSTTDVTRTFTGAALRLPPGRVVKDEAFTLFEAVSAIEIGDAKMDSGYLLEGESLEDDFNVAQPLSAEQIIWMMDELFYHEAAWNLGHALSQTLFTSLHINALLWPEPKLIADCQFTTILDIRVGNPLLHLVFRSYCLALIKACDLVRDMVTSQHFYEEEDLTSQIFHRELLHRFGAHEIEMTLGDALRWLEDAKIEPKLLLALKYRLECRQQILRLLGAASDAKRLSECQSDSCLWLLAEIKKSTNLGSPIPEAFSLKVQRTLASSVPPRPMIRMESEQAFTFITQLFADLSRVHELLTLDHPGRLLPGFWTFMAQTPPASVYVRAVTQSIVSQENNLPGGSTLKDFLFKELRRLVLPGSVLLDHTFEQVEVPSDQRFHISRQLDDFVSKCGPSYLNIYRAYCLNRCRIRRTLCHAVVEWDQLQADAEECDAAIQLLTGEKPQIYHVGDVPTYSYPLSSWVYHQKLHQMELIILMGFELSIYAMDEIPKLYWHLSQVIAVHVSHLDRMSHFAEQVVEANNVSIQSPKLATGITEKETCLRELYHEYARLKAFEMLALSLHLVFVFLHRHNLVQQPPRQYNAGQLRYELRMRPFLNLSVPEPMPYDEYEASAGLKGLGDLEILDRASRHCSLAKRAWEEILKTHQSRPLFPAAAKTLTSEWIKDVKDTIRACIATNIAISMLKKISDRPSTTEQKKALRSIKVSLPAFGERGSYHRFWAVPSIQL